MPTTLRPAALCRFEFNTFPNPRYHPGKFTLEIAGGISAYTAAKPQARMALVSALLPAMAFTPRLCSARACACCRALRQLFGTEPGFPFQQTTPQLRTRCASACPPKIHKLPFDAASAALPSSLVPGGAYLLCRRGAQCQGAWAAMQQGVLCVCARAVAGR